MLNADLQITHYLHLFVLPHNTNESFTSLKHVSGQSFTFWFPSLLLLFHHVNLSQKNTSVVFEILLLLFFYFYLNFIQLLPLFMCFCSVLLADVLRSTIHSLSHQPLKTWLCGKMPVFQWFVKYSDQPI